MAEIVAAARSKVGLGDLPNARLGPRFGRLDLCCQLAVLAVERLGIRFEGLARDRIGTCLAVKAGSLATDFEYWKGCEAVGGPSPTLFAYTLPSSALGEIAIRYRITGPNLCFFGDDGMLLAEGENLIRTGEAEGCLCVSCRVVTPEIAEILRAVPVSEATAVFLHEARCQGKSP